MLATLNQSAGDLGILKRQQALVAYSWWRQFLASLTVRLLVSGVDGQRNSRRRPLLRRWSLV